jgi:hydrogenase-4 membrane subunit HyfE
LKSVVIVSAVLLALIGFFASATSPNPSDHLAGKVLIAIAAGFVVLALCAPPKITASVYFGAIALVVVAYSLPMSFWRAVGLAKEQPSRSQDSRSSTGDRK